MTRKESSVYICQSCGSVSPKWLGKCPDCNQWNTYLEEKTLNITGSKRRLKTVSSPISLEEVEAEKINRITTKIAELDRVLGGGIVPGSTILLGGNPGIGKSTLALQLANNLQLSGHKTLYISGEESYQQIKLRADRLLLDRKDILLSSETNLENILEIVSTHKAEIAIIDSIQTISTDELESPPGSIGQIRECGAKLTAFGKSTGTSFIVIGHVTKEGAIAGPKVLEHLVDTVVYFEGAKGNTYRIIRTMKNRFGSTNEVGVFEMHNNGLEEVRNPSKTFLSERPIDAAGSVVIPSIEGTRPILVELQALVSKCSFGAPRRTTIGLDSQKVSLLAAVIEKMVGIDISSEDIFMNVVGGISVSEPAIDLGICMALLSSFLDKPLPPELVVFGEVGLSGEVRGVSLADIRLQESVKLGFSKCLMPKSNFEQLKTKKPRIKIIPVSSLKQSIESLF